MVTFLGENVACKRALTSAVFNFSGFIALGAGCFGNVSPSQMLRMCVLARFVVGTHGVNRTQSAMPLVFPFPYC